MHHTNLLVELGIFKGQMNCKIEAFGGWTEEQITRKKSLSHFSRRFLKILRKNLKNLKKIPNSKKISKITKIFKKISRDLNLCHFFFDFFALRMRIPFRAILT